VIIMMMNERSRRLLTGSVVAFFLMSLSVVACSESGPQSPARSSRSAEPAASASAPKDEKEKYDVIETIPAPQQDLPPAAADSGPAPMRNAVFAGGCFWCTEAVFQELEGVEDVVSGYAGGDEATADYQTVCTGRTDHAEAIRITYDPSKITYGRLLHVFFATHDPTQLNRQGADVGRQYRSAVFYADESERQVAEAYIRQLDASGAFGKKKIATTLEPLEAFYPAESYHQYYADRNPDQPYIRFNALPKIDKVRKLFGGSVKEKEEEGEG
jgi:peptide-methionine (S)-S-oxide reductase